MTKLVVVFGTRPEAIKLGPVVAELRSLGIQPDVVATGQHWDLLRGTPAETDLREAQSLGLASDGNITRWQTKAERLLTSWLSERQPKAVVVQGDTMSALAGARAAVACRLPVVHVEAGLRSHNPHNPWPEEVTRVELAQLATWHLAPTPTAARHLLAEGVHLRQIRITGNTVVSALGRYAGDVVPVANPEPMVVVTMHRREVQTPALAAHIWRQLYQLAMARPDWRVFWSVHPGFARFGGSLAMPPNVTLSAPMPYAGFAATVARAALVITDSGGLAEEAVTLGVPSVIWRAVNDRPEAVEAGLAVLCDPETDMLQKAAATAVAFPRTPSSVFGTAGAAGAVAAHLAGLL